LESRPNEGIPLRFEVLSDDTLEIGTPGRILYVEQVYIPGKIMVIHKLNYKILWRVSGF
jgi:hypothetical protein